MILSNPKINLAEYLEEATSIKNILVGLEYITELLDSDNANNIPYYHCNLTDCYNEQGKARQIYKHINSYSHKQAWIKQTKELRLGTRENINDWLRNNHVDQQSYKTISDNSMWDDCRQSLLRSQQIFEYFQDNAADLNQIQTKSSGIKMNLKPNIHSQTSLIEPSPQVIQAESPTKLKTSMVRVEENISENLSATTLSANEVRPPDINQGLVFSVSVDELLGDKSDSEAMNSDDNSPFPNTQFSDSAFGQISPGPQTVGNIGSHTDIGVSSQQQQIFENIEAGQLPADQTLANQTLADQPLTDQTPANQPPIDQPPADQPPVDQPPADQPPVDQPPADQLPAQQPRVAKRRPFPKPIPIKVEPVPTVKNEVVKNERPKDILQTCSSFEQENDPTNLTSSKSLDPELQYKIMVYQNVNAELYKYFIESEKLEKSPMILSKSEFEVICKHLSRNHREEVRQSWTFQYYPDMDEEEAARMTPTLDRNEIMEYGLDFLIQHYFSNSDHYKDIVKKRKNMFK